MPVFRGFVHRTVIGFSFSSHVSTPVWSLGQLCLSKYIFLSSYRKSSLRRKVKTCRCFQKWSGNELFFLIFCIFWVSRKNLSLELGLYSTILLVLLGDIFLPCGSYLCPGMPLPSPTWWTPFPGRPPRPWSFDPLVSWPALRPTLSSHRATASQLGFGLIRSAGCGAILGPKKG